MKKLSILFFFIVSANVLFAQKIFYVGGSISPDICYKEIPSTEYNRTIKIGYTTGLNSIYTLSSKLSLEVGLQLSNKGYRTKEDKFVYYSYIDQLDPEYLDINSYRFKYNYYYLDIPTKLNFYFKERKKSRRFLSFGISTNVFIHGKTKAIYKYNSGKIRKESFNANRNSFNTRLINPALVAGFGYEGILTSNSILRIEPIFKISLFNIYNNQFKSLLISGGLNISVLFNSKK